MKKETYCGSESNLPPAVVLGLSPTGLHVVRELGRTGVQVIGVCHKKQAGSVSRYLSQCIVEENEIVRLKKICSLFDERKEVKPVLIPTSDQDIDFVVKHEKALGKYFTFQGSYKSGLATQIMEKETFYELCETHNVAYPALWKGRAGGILPLRDEINYPCMIKPSRIQDVKDKLKGEKGWIVHSGDEFDRIVPLIPKEAGMLLLQEIVPGTESNITLYCGYFDMEGKPQQSFTARKLRQYPPGFGSASLVQSCDEVESREIAETLLKKLGYQGIAAAEFKRDPVSDELKIIEINVRPSLWFSLSSAAGRPVVLSGFLDMAGSENSISVTPQIQGVRWRYWLKDVSSIMFYKLRKSFTLPAPQPEIVGPGIRETNAVFAVDDMKPAIAEIVGYFQKALARIWR